MNRYRIDLSGQTVGLDFDVETCSSDSVTAVVDIVKEYDIVRLITFLDDSEDQDWVNGRIPPTISLVSITGRNVSLTMT